MQLSTVAIVVFVAVTVATVALVMLVRDLWFDRSAESGTGRPARKLRRIETVHDRPAPRGIFDRIDRAFDYLIWESDIGATPTTAFLLLLACMLVCGGCTLLYTDDVLSASVGGMAGMILPLGWLLVRRHRRMWLMKEELPHVLEMLSRAVRAGQSIDQATKLVGEEIQGVLGREFAMCSQQLEMGRSFSAVFKALATRIRLLDIRILTTTLIVQRQTGGNLADTLERMSGVVRDRLTAARQMRATTGAGRTSTLMIAVICPLAYVFMFMFMPRHMEVFYNESFGRMLLTTALTLEAIGLFWVFMLLRAEE